MLETLVGWVMILVALGATFMKWQLSARVRAASSWPVTRGEVVSSELTTSTNVVNGTPNKTRKASLKYRFKVGSRQYTGHKICVGGQLQVSWSGRAESYLQQYPEGEEVDVYYNPKKPADAVLEVREETSGMYLLVAVLFGVVGIIFLS